MRRKAERELCADQMLRDGAGEILVGRDAENVADERCDRLLERDLDFDAAGVEKFGRVLGEEPLQLGDHEIAVFDPEVLQSGNRVDALGKRFRGGPASARRAAAFTQKGALFAEPRQ